jgi:hypothetical protein
MNFVVRLGGYRLVLKGDSMRKQRGPTLKSPAPAKSKDG